MADPPVAVLLAQAHWAVGGVAAAATWATATLVVPGRSPDGRPGPDAAAARHVDRERTPPTLFGLAPVVAEAARGAGLEIRLDVDLSAPSTDGPVERPAEHGGLARR